MGLVETKALDASDSVKPLAVSKDTGKTVNGICRNNNDPISIQYFHCFPYASRIWIVWVNVDDQNEGCNLKRIRSFNHSLLHGQLKTVRGLHRLMGASAAQVWH